MLFQTFRYTSETSCLFERTDGNDAFPSQKEMIPRITMRCEPADIPAVDTVSFRQLSGGVGIIFYGWATPWFCFGCLRERSERKQSDGQPVRLTPGPAVASQTQKGTKDLPVSQSVHSHIHPSGRTGDFVLCSLIFSRESRSIDQ